MGTYALPQISNIISKRPNKKRVQYAQKVNKKMMLHLHGVGMKNALARLQYFENNDVYMARRDYALSNVDLFGRLLQEEEQVFTTRGGSSYFNLPAAQEKEMNILLSDVVYGQTLRQWVHNFGLNAYRADPMGVIFMEVEKVTAIEGVDNVEAGKPLQYNIETPKCYPTYKCSQDIWEYQCNGRGLDYVCFALTDAEMIEYGLKEQDTTAYPIPTSKVGINKQYFRWVDDSQDVIVKLENSSDLQADKSGSQITVLTLDGQANPMNIGWSKVPGFIISDLIKFTDPGTFDTPLVKVVELADAFLYDRSIHTLSKKYHGFPKAVEPLLPCAYCSGEGMKKGKPCPECTIPGADKGTGYKLQTKVSDVAKFPITILNKDAAPHFDFRMIFGYVTPDIAGIGMQVDGLKSLEELMFITYWTKNNNQIQGQNGKVDTKDTATQVLTDLPGKAARLNCTANWAEQTENMIANFIGEFWFEKPNFKSNISYGRDYIFETPETILDVYYDMKANGVPDSMLDHQYEKYLNCVWQSNPVQLGVYRKKFDVEPFPHLSAESVEKSEYVTEDDKICKRYFGEWDDTVSDGDWTFGKVEILKAALLAFAQQKMTTLDADTEKDIALQAKTAAASSQPTIYIMATTVKVKCVGVNRWEWDKDNELSYSFDQSDTKGNVRANFGFTEVVKKNVKLSFEIDKVYTITIS